MPPHRVLNGSDEHRRIEWPADANRYIDPVRGGTGVVAFQLPHQFLRKRDRQHPDTWRGTQRRRLGPARTGAILDSAGQVRQRLIFEECLERQLDPELLMDPRAHLRRE